MNEYLEKLNSDELANLINLHKVHQLVGAIEAKAPKEMQLIPHMRLYSDGSGGLFDYKNKKMDYVEIAGGWDNLEEAVVMLTEFLESL